MKRICSIVLASGVPAGIDMFRAYIKYRRARFSEDETYDEFSAASDAP